MRFTTFRLRTLFCRTRKNLKSAKVKLDLAKSRFDLLKRANNHFCCADVNFRLRVKFPDEKQELCDIIDCEVQVYLILFIILILQNSYLSWHLWPVAGKRTIQFAFPTAFRRFQLSLTAFQRFCYINTLLKLGWMRFVYSHSFVSVNRVCTIFILILLWN